MPINIQMPALSPTMEEGTLAKWLVKEGDEVAAGDLLAEIETDKATMEFEAVDEGTIAKIVVPEGTDNVKVGEIIAIIAEDGEDVGDVDAAEALKKAAATPAKDEPEERRKGDRRQEDRRKVDLGGDDEKIDRREEGDRRQGDRRASAEETPAAAPSPAPAQPTSTGDRVKASPLARRIAADKGIDLSSIAGSGPNGRIIKADVEDAPAGVAAPMAAAATSDDPFHIPHTSEKLSNMRKTIARRLTEAKQTIPHIYLTVDIQLDRLLSMRKELNETLEPRGIKLSVNDLLIKALAVSLMRVPKCNVSIDGDQLKTFQRADISVAVSIEGGLITPIVTSADTKPVSQISTEMKDLAGRAKDGKLQMHEYQGGTASISNMGMFGIKNFDAVINPPQAMIMAIGAGAQRPHVVDGELTVATVMSATGSFDHRAIDGADGAELMKVFKELVESPLGMLA